MTFVWSCASSPWRVTMSKSHPKPHPKSRKRSQSKGKHVGLAAKAPMEEREPAAKTVKEQKPLSHFVLEFFLLLVFLLWKLFSFGPRENKKEPSLSLERPDAASSSSALATPSGVNVAAKRASEEQTEGPAEEILFGTVNDKDPCPDPNWTVNSNEALTLGPEGLEAVFSSNRVMVGELWCPDRVGYQTKEVAKINSLKRVDVVEDDEIKFERPGSDSGDWKQKHDDLQKKYDDLKKKCEVFDKTVVLRELFSDFRKTRSAKIMDDGLMKQVLKLRAAKSEMIDRIIVKFSYTRLLLLMQLQRANIALKSRFCSIGWRNHHRFPKFSNGDADYQWWEQNFVPEILEKRLEVLRVAAKNWDPKLEIFMVMKLVSDLNSRLHRQPREDEFNEKDEFKVFECEGIDLQTTICYLRSGGDSKI